MPAGSAPVAPTPLCSARNCRAGPDSRPGKGSPGRTGPGWRIWGPKVIYYYNGMKVTFINGKVSDVQ